MSDEESDATGLPLEHFKWPYQIEVPFSSPTASFQAGANGVTGIELTSMGVVVYVKKGSIQYELWFAAGGFGYRVITHKRSHKPDHKGSGK